METLSQPSDHPTKSETPGRPPVHPAARPDDFFYPGLEIAYCDPFFQHAAMEGFFVCTCPWNFTEVHALEHQHTLTFEIPDKCVVYLCDIAGMPYVLEAGWHDYNIMRKDELMYLQDHPEAIDQYLDQEPFGERLDRHISESHHAATKYL